MGWEDSIDVYKTEYTAKSADVIRGDFRDFPANGNDRFKRENKTTRRKKPLSRAITALFYMINQCFREFDFRELFRSSNAKSASIIIFLPTCEIALLITPLFFIRLAVTMEQFSNLASPAKP